MSVYAILFIKEIYKNYLHNLCMPFLFIRACQSHGKEISALTVFASENSENKHLVIFWGYF